MSDSGAQLQLLSQTPSVVLVVSGAAVLALCGVAIAWLRSRK